MNLNPAKGDQWGRLLWFFILVHQPWTHMRRPAWATNVTLAEESGLKNPRYVRLGLQRLREEGLLETPDGIRPGAARKYGRTLVPRIGCPVKLLVPSRKKMASIWALCRRERKRPAAVVTLAVGLYASAAAVLDRHPRAGETVKIQGTISDLRKLVGARKGHAFTERLRVLERLGILRREGRQLMLAPLECWHRSEQEARPVLLPRPPLRSVVRPPAREPAWELPSRPLASIRGGWEDGPPLDDPRFAPMASVG